MVWFCLVLRPASFPFLCSFTDLTKSWSDDQTFFFLDQVFRSNVILSLRVRSYVTLLCYVTRSPTPSWDVSDSEWTVQIRGNHSNFSRLLHACNTDSVLLLTKLYTLRVRIECQSLNTLSSIHIIVCNAAVQHGLPFFPVVFWTLLLCRLSVVFHLIIISLDSHITYFCCWNSNAYNLINWRYNGVVQIQWILHIKIYM